MSEIRIIGPFGPAKKILSLSVADILAEYRRKCGADVSRSFAGLAEIDLFECLSTGYQFWQPATVAADEETYRLLSAAWPGYYRPERWEYKFVRKTIRKADKLLEVGSGRGYFLRSIESLVKSAEGLEFNAEAIDDKVTKFAITRLSVEDYAKQHPGEMDIVCSFQVLEHVVDPSLFINACLACLRPGGLLILSTPNRDSAMLKSREDAFDMPPHHIGHFSTQVYQAIARNLRVEVVRILVERRDSWASDTLSKRTNNHMLYRLIKATTVRMLNLIYWILREPGNNILVIMRKPS